MTKTYTEIYKGFQIRDPNYINGEIYKAQKDTPPHYDVVHWDDNRSMCWSVASLYYDPKEPCFELQSIGLRWLEQHPDNDVEDWIIKWCEYKLQELYNAN